MSDLISLERRGFGLDSLNLPTSGRHSTIAPCAGLMAANVQVGRFAISALISTERVIIIASQGTQLRSRVLGCANQTGTLPARARRHQLQRRERIAIASNDVAHVVVQGGQEVQ